MKTSFHKSRENKRYIIGLIITTLMFVIFFTSKLWMYDDTPIAQTEFNTEITGLDQTILKLNTWEYNPEKELMEVTLELQHDGDDPIKPTFTFEAQERDSDDDYEVEVVYQDDTTAVIQIHNVTDEYRVIGLFVREHRDKRILEAELKEQNNISSDNNYNDTDGEEIEVDVSEIEPTERIIVGDYRRINVNNKLAHRNEKAYQIESVEREIAMVESEMKTILEESIPLEEELIQVYQDEISTLEDDLQFQTGEEQEETEMQIAEREESIIQAEADIEAMQAEVEDELEKHGILEEKLLAIESQEDPDLMEIFKEKYPTVYEDFQLSLDNEHSKESNNKQQDSPVTNQNPIEYLQKLDEAQRIFEENNQSNNDSNNQQQNGQKDNQKDKNTGENNNKESSNSDKKNSNDSDKDSNNDKKDDDNKNDKKKDKD